MARFKQPYVLIKRTLKSGKKVFYVRYPGQTMKSTGCTNRIDADRYAQKHLKSSQLTLENVLETAYIWGECPHIQRLLDEKKSISHHYAENQRRLLDNYLVGDEICTVPLYELKRGHFIDFRNRLLAKTSDKQANRVIKAIRVILNEYEDREEIESNPAEGVGLIAEHKDEIGVFTRQELRELFDTAPGPWPSLHAYTVFLLAASTGMRRGEILGLTWAQISFDNSSIYVGRAIKPGGTKHNTRIGKPKWGRVRSTVLPAKAKNTLLQLRNATPDVLPDRLVFESGKGDHYSDSWWADNFRRTMLAIGVRVRDEAGKISNPRHIKPHSLRHSVNTILRAEGVDAAKLRASFGWSDEKTQDGYTHWSVEHFGDQRDIVDEVLG